MNSAEPPKAHAKPSSGGIWHRPGIYIAIVAIYLLGSSALAIGIAVYLDHSYRKALSDAGVGAGLGGLFEVGMYTWVIMFSALSITGAIYLLKGCKTGLYYSLAAMMFFTLSLIMLLLIRSGQELGFDLKNDFQFILVFSFLASSNIAMYALLMLGRKHVQRK